MSQIHSVSPANNGWIWLYVYVIICLQGIHADDKEFNIAIELLSAIGELTAEQNGHTYIK